MPSRRLLVFVWAGVFASFGASYRTQNFVVEAPTPQVAQQICQAAEVYRKEKALLWLGREMPPWPEPLPVKVKVTMSGAGGATSFVFHGGQVLEQKMNIEGSLDRLLSSVLPHEVTHTVFAFHFRQAVPRWADEGGAVLSEDDAERNRHDQLCRQILNGGRAMPLRRLLSLTEYPRDVMVLYAQGFSVVDFLVGQSSRPAFLNFIAQGMQQGWDTAVQTHYRYRNVEEMEQAWLQALRDSRGQPNQLARNTTPPAGADDPRVLVRRTIPPVQPLDPPAVTFRGVAPAAGQEGERFGEWPRPQAASPQGYLPAPPASNGWQPIPVEAPQAPPLVRLGAPVFGPGQ